MIRYIFIVLVVLAVAVGAYFLLVPGASEPFRSVEKVTDADKVNQMVLAFVGAPYPDDYGVMRVPGWIDNETSSEMRAAQLQIQLLDEDGVKKEKVTHEVTDIKPKSRKTFDINAGAISGSREATISVVWVEVYK